MKDVLPALGTLLFSLVWTSVMLLSPRPNEPIAAIYPPWVTSHDAFAATIAAGAPIIRGFGGWNGVVVLEFTDIDLPARLRRAGAFLVIRASRLASCSQ